MWKLLKSEINYYKWLYIISLLFVLFVNIGLTISGRWAEAQNDFPGLRVIWLGIGIVVLFFTILFNRKSGRLRLIKLIPLTNIQYSLSRLITFIIFWLLLALILIVFYLFNFYSLPNKNWTLNLISISGIVLLINSIPVIYSDFYGTYFGKLEKFVIGLFWGILWIIYISMNIIFSTYLDFVSPETINNTREVLKEFYFTDTATLSNIIIGVFAFTISNLTYSQRKSYLE